MKLTVLRPDGGELTSATSGSGAFALTETAPTTGTYTIVAQPAQGGKGRLGIRATSR